MRKHAPKLMSFLSMLAFLPVLVFPGAALAVPDGILSPGNSTPTIADALKALRIAVKIDPQTADALAHGDVAPIVNGNSIGDGEVNISDALAILKKAVNLITWNNGAPLAVADKVSVVDAKSGAVQASAARMPRLAVPIADLTSDSAYKTDQTFVYVNDRATEALSSINEILCMISQARADAMLNKGPYKAFINANLCSGNDSAANAGQSQQGDASASAAPDYEIWTLDATRADDASPQIIKAWVHSTEKMGPGQDMDIVINAKMVITEPSTTDNPYGIFDLSFSADPPPGITLPPDQPYLMQGKLQAVRENGQVVLKFINNSGNRTEKANLTKDASGTGKGNVFSKESFPDPNNPQNIISDKRQFNIAFDDNLFHRVSGDGAKDFCFDRNKFETSAWRYGLYDSDTGARINVNSGFPIKVTTDRDYFGWVGYWGLGLPNGVTLPDGATVYKQVYGAHGGSQEPYTVLVKNGKLKKHIKSVITLGDIVNVPLEGSIPDPANPGPGMTMYRLTWDGTDLAIRAEAAMNPNGPPVWQEISPAVVIDSATHLPFGDLSFWAQSLGGQVRIQLSGCSYTPPILNPDGTMTSGYTTCSKPLTDTPVVFYREDIVYPGDTVPVNLACYDNCPQAGADGMTYDQFGNPSTYPPDFSPTAAGHSYAFDSMLLKDKGNDVLLKTAYTDPQTGTTREWGFNSGPLFDPTPANMTKLACDWTGPNGETSICGWKAWSALDEFYTWETGPNNWNRLSAVTDGTGQVVRFDPPLRVEYTHAQTDINKPDYKYNGVKFYLDYSGFGQLNGIPGKCVDMNSGMSVLDCSREGVRWVPEFTIPEGRSVSSSTGGTTATYYVKPLEMEQRMQQAQPGSCASLPVDPFDFANFKLTTLNWQNPALGAEPSLNGAPAVIGGVVQ